MAQPSVYSFKDTKMVINPIGFQSYSLDGQGVGEIAINYANENTVHDLAADGTVMVSKIATDNGNVSITVQQSSTLHSYLKGVFNGLMASPSALWVGINISVSSRNGTGDNITLTGVSFAKRADQPFQAQGQRVTWNFMAANIQTSGSVLAAINNI